MECIVGQPSWFQYCSKMSTLTEMISTIGYDTKIVVVSCLTNIVHSMSASGDAKSNLIRGMTILGTSIRDLIRHRHGNLRIMLAPCTPRNIPDFNRHSKFALVSLNTVN